VAFGPLWSVTAGQTDPGAKSTASFIFASRNFRKMPNLVKIIVNYLYVGKMHMIYQNAQKNMLYILVSISCIVKQFEPCPK
jgi:hypothetical protein